MKKWIGLLLVVGILLLAGSFILAAQDSTAYYYKGKDIFRTTEEYGIFKEAVGVPEVTIWETLVLSSEPPIVVVYWVEVPKGLDFPYGEKDFLPSGLLFNLLLVFGALGTAVGGALTILGIRGRVWQITE